MEKGSEIHDGCLRKAQHEIQVIRTIEGHSCYKTDPCTIGKDLMGSLSGAGFDLGVKN
jgi:hypothetical protein